MLSPTRALLALTLGSALVCAAAGEPQPAFLRVAEITLDPPEKEQQVVSVRMTPGVTRAYTQLRFECIYRQEYDWTDSSGKQQRRVNEPVRFPYERDQVKLTDDLDAYVSFKMPIGIELLRSRFGSTTFRTDVPVTVARIRIEARDGETTVWAYEVPTTPGPQTLTDAQRADLAAPAAAATSKPRSERAAFGTVDLD
jgi:hypothetical protein